MPSPIDRGASLSNSIEWLSRTAGLVRSAGSGRLFREPLATDIRFSNAAAGLKNIWENLDHGTDPNRTVVAIRYKERNKISKVVFPVV